jgi:hypothetical protein
MSRSGSLRARTTDDIPQHMADIAWDRIEADLDARGFAVAEQLLSPSQCKSVIELFPDDACFRKHVVMAQHGYGCGEYKYFSYPLPGLVAALRETAYPYLAEVANRWNAEMGIETRYPDKLAAFLKRCHTAGQTRPTPLLLQYHTGDYNRLHQDLYGAHAFPLQMTILLSEPGQDFTGGEFVLTEQPARMQPRATVVPLGQGDTIVFAVHHRPVQGTRGFRRANLRHGVSELRSGRRYTLGIIFHDAKS